MRNESVYEEECKEKARKKSDRENNQEFSIEEYDATLFSDSIDISEYTYIFLLAKVCEEEKKEYDRECREEYSTDYDKDYLQYKKSSLESRSSISVEA
jgi:hypothetical protein